MASPTIFNAVRSVSSESDDDVICPDSSESADGHDDNRGNEEDEDRSHHENNHGIEDGDGCSWNTDDMDIYGQSPHTYSIESSLSRNDGNITKKGHSGNGGNINNKARSRNDGKKGTDGSSPDGHNNECYNDSNISKNGQRLDDGNINNYGRIENDGGIEESSRSPNALKIDEDGSNNDARNKVPHERGKSDKGHENCPGE